jgi:hypothetical protein
MVKTWMNEISTQYIKSKVCYSSMEYDANRCQRAQRHDKEMEEMEPSDSFAMNLRPYQKQALR